MQHYLKLVYSISMIGLFSSACKKEGIISRAQSISTTPALNNRGGSARKSATPYSDAIKNQAQVTNQLATLYKQRYILEKEDGRRGSSSELEKNAAKLRALKGDWTTQYDAYKQSQKRGVGTTFSQRPSGG